MRSIVPRSAGPLSTDFTHKATVKENLRTAEL